MDIEITKQADNALFGRTDVQFVIRHDAEATPSRVQVRQLIAGEIGSKTENVVVDHMESATGMSATRGAARAYKSTDLARAQERQHLLKRNNMWQERSKAAKEEAEAEA